jgi:hypothetical protein
MRLVTLSVLTLLAGCGEATAVILDVDLGGLQVPAEVDTLHFRLEHAPDFVADRSYDLTTGEDRASLTIEQGAHTPDSLTVQAFADLAGVPVGATTPVDVQFKAGEIGHVYLVVQH